jgi:hypothetical protein
MGEAAKVSPVVQKPIVLTLRSIEKVLVEPDDRDRFVVTAAEAAQACKQFDDVKEWQGKFNALLDSLREWCEQQAEIVASAYVAVVDGCLIVVVGTKGEDYSFDFDDEITDLDLKLIEEYPWLIAEILHVPAQSLERHVSTEKAIQVYGDGTRTQSASPTQPELSRDD